MRARGRARSEVWILGAVVALGGGLAVALALWLGAAGERPPPTVSAQAPAEPVPRADAPLARPERVAAAREATEVPPPEPSTAPDGAQLGWVALDGGGGPRPARPRDEGAAPAGDVRGRLRSESRAWPDLDALLQGGVTLELVQLEAPEGPPLVLRADLEPSEEPDGEIVLAFAFENVPAGRYALELSSLGPYRWAPERLVVSPPATGLELLRHDADRAEAVAFRVLDAATGEPVEGWRAWRLRRTVSETAGVLLQAGQLDLEQAAVDVIGGGLEWSLGADGYAPAFGDERAFEPGPDGTSGARVATVELQRGWATRFVVLGRDPDMRVLPGVEIELDGDVVGRTDADGSLVARRAALPERLTVRWRDWIVERGELVACDDADARLRGHVTPVVLRAP